MHKHLSLSPLLPLHKAVNTLHGSLFFSLFLRVHRWPFRLLFPKITPRLYDTRFYPWFLCLYAGVEGVSPAPLHGLPRPFEGEHILCNRASLLAPSVLYKSRPSGRNNQLRSPTRTPPHTHQAQQETRMSRYTPSRNTDGKRQISKDSECSEVCCSRCYLARR